MIRPPHKRLFGLTLILLAAAALRIPLVGASDFSVDEAWSMMHSYYASMMTEASFLASILSEPNNAAHLVAVRPILAISPDAFGLRLLSVFTGMLTVALAARLTFRLFRRQDMVFVVAAIVTLAYGAMWTSRYGRPYATANMFALASFVAWLEHRWYTNMLTSMATALFHVGAMPTVILQDLLMVWRAWRGQHVDWLQWVVNRVVVYTMFGLVLYMVHYRLLIDRDVSSGQTLMSPLAMVRHLMGMIHDAWLGGSPGVWGWSFALLVVLPIAVYGIFLMAKRKLPRITWLLLAWVAISYGALTAMVILGDGPIKSTHLSIVLVPTAMAAACVLVKMPRPALMAVSLAFVLIVGANSLHRVSAPARPFTRTVAYLHEAYPPDTVFYFNSLSVIWAIQLSLNGTDIIRELPEEVDSRPAQYHYVRFRQWLMVPPECGPEPYDHFWEMTLFLCNREVVVSN